MVLHSNLPERDATAPQLEIFNLNLRSTLIATQAALRHLESRGPTLTSAIVDL
jgi:hypothetical protein